MISDLLRLVIPKYTLHIALWGRRSSRRDGAGPETDCGEPLENLDILRNYSCNTPKNTLDAAPFLAFIWALGVISNREIDGLGSPRQPHRGNKKNSQGLESSKNVDP